MSLRIAKIAKFVLCAVLTAFVAAGFATKHSAAADLTLATWGGSYADAFNATMNDPFTEKTGHTVKIIPGVSLSNYKLIAAQRDNPQIDLVMLSTLQAIRASKEGLFEALDESEIPNVKNVVDSAVMKTSDGKYLHAGMWGDTVVLAYRHDLAPFEITSWLDLWDPRLKGKVAVSSPKTQESSFLLIINKIVGGNENNVDPGFKKIKELGDNLVAVATDNAMQKRLLAQGEAWVVPMEISAVKSIIEEGLPVKWVAPKEGAYVEAGMIAVVKNAPNLEAAIEYMNFILSNEILMGSAEAIGLAPLTRMVAKGEYALSADDMARLNTFDADIVNKNLGAWIERWQRDIAPLISD
jgi:putative spermidine/putrescine transport system substrate-binding protein